MTKPVVLIAEELSPATVDALGPDFEVRHCDGADRAELLPAIADVDAMLVRSATQVDAEALAAATRLRVVARAGVGLDNVDVTAATRGRRHGRQRADLQHRLRRRARGRRCCWPRPATSRRPTPRSRAGRGSAASTPASSCSRRPSASSASAGSACSSPQRLAAFGMKVVAYDPYVQRRAGRADGRPAASASTSCSRQSDFITVHLPKTPETVGLIGEEALNRSSPSVRIVNAARGGIVDEEALATALKEGRVAGAGLDVYAKEPCTDSPLFELRDRRRHPAPRRLHRRGAGEGRHRRRPVGAAGAGR